MHQADVFYQAMLARDYRFDGKFFVGVRTTGIYCCPICPAKPKRENVEFFNSATAAEKGGYRPCLRCRPETAPLSPSGHCTSAVVQRALRRIAANQLLELQEEPFAEQFGVTARHLRRLFVEELGHTPKQISDNNRLNFACKLIVETRMPMTEVATTAGFASLRRFNDAFKRRFARAPLQLRKSKVSVSGDGVELNLAFRPPYDWETILSFFWSHRIPGIETIANNSYQRQFKLDGESGWLRVGPSERPHQLRLRVILSNLKPLFVVVSRVRQMFDLDSDPLLIANSFAQVGVLATLTRQFPGLRLPRGWDPFETATCAILGQLVSTDRARDLIGQLVEHYGEGVGFPSAESLANCDLARVKTTQARKATLREFSRQIMTGEISLSDAQDPQRFRESLLAIKGIGPWSAEYISLRAIGDTDAFPATDLILRRALDLHPGLDLDAVKPWRSYAAIYLWKGFAQALSRRKDKK